MRLPLKWEFPGGKVEPGESEEACIVREIHEETGLHIKIISRMGSFSYDDGKQVIRLIPFRCVIEKGEVILTEHHAFKWIRPQEMQGLDWAPADIAVVAAYLELVGTE